MFGNYLLAFGLIKLLLMFPVVSLSLCISFILVLLEVLTLKDWLSTQLPTRHW